MRATKKAAVEFTTLSRSVESVLVEIQKFLGHKSKRDLPSLGSIQVVFFKVKTRSVHFTRSRSRMIRCRPIPERKWFTSVKIRRVRLSQKEFQRVGRAIAIGDW